MDQEMTRDKGASQAALPAYAGRTWVAGARQVPVTWRVGQAFTMRAGPITRTSRLIRCGEAPLPGLGAMARNLTRAVGRAVRAVATGGRAVTTPAESARRHAVCRQNRCGLYRASDDRCAACGCWQKAKAWAQKETCPAGFW